MTDQANDLGEARALRRVSAGHLLGGVASGLAQYLDLDVAVVRLAFVVLALVGGAGVPLYVAGWLLIPDEHTGISIAADLLGRHQVV